MIFSINDRFQSTIVSTNHPLFPILCSPTRQQTWQMAGSSSSRSSSRDMPADCSNFDSIHHS
ncbi:MAG: hypothetical protein J2P13_04255, partial [Acidobacteria bacterium]|nr:hypothetical protein [Acidobacteriota bacterium]